MEAAVVSATLGAGAILLRKLGNMVADRHMYLGDGLRHEIQELKDELDSLAACLRDLDSSGDDDSRNQLVRHFSAPPTPPPPTHTHLSVCQSVRFRPEYSTVINFFFRYENWCTYEYICFI